MLLKYLLAINVLTFAVYGVDKWKARRGRWRVPEATLMGLAALGGSVGAWLAMQRAGYFCIAAGGGGVLSEHAYSSLILTVETIGIYFHIDINRSRFLCIFAL